MKEKEVRRQFLARLKELHKETGLELTILGMQTPEIGPYLMGKADALEVASQVTRAYATVSGIRAFLIHEEARMLDMAASKRENPYHADAQLARICIITGRVKRKTCGRRWKHRKLAWCLQMSKVDGEEG